MIDKNKIFLIATSFMAFFIIGCILHFSFGTYYYGEPRGFTHILGPDDAYISYRYGWNIVHFNTLSWNESGFRKTEGFTNPLWVYVSALWSLFGNKDLIYPGMAGTSVVITGALLIGLLFLVYRNHKFLYTLIGVLLFFASPVNWLHTVSGLEASVFGSAIALVAYYAITNDQITRRDLWIGNILVIFIVFLRSDGFAYIAILLFSLILAKRKSFKMVVVGEIVGLALLLTWRLVNFGEFAPNTQIAKLNFGFLERMPTGMFLFLKSMSSGWAVFVVLGMLGVLSAPKAYRLAVLLTILGWSSYYIYIGGDLFLERHLFGVAALSAAISGYFFANILQKRFGWFLLLIFLLVLYTPFYNHDPRFLYFQPKPPDPWVLLGKEMSLHRNEYGTVVIFPAGKIPFFAGGDFIDELGLNDSDLARIRRPRFVPGHSAGSHEMALIIARQFSTVNSYFAYNLQLSSDNSENVLLWVDNYLPQDGVHYGLKMDQIEAMMQADPFEYTLILRDD
jgi:hypothetical protein